MSLRFPNRIDAGRQLAERLGDYTNRTDVVVLGLPRGGIPVAFEVAVALGVPLDICLVRKLGCPETPELALAAIAPGGTFVLSDVAHYRHLTSRDMQELAAVEQKELQRRERVYRGNRPPLLLRGRTVILVDDGVATGATLRAGIAFVRRHQPAAIVVAVPVAAADTYRDLVQEVDRVVCLSTPEDLYAISLWYDDFPQTTDAEVCSLLETAEFKAAGDTISPNSSSSVRSA
jgi:putative phosphoribosyl transferase